MYVLGYVDWHRQRREPHRLRREETRKLLSRLYTTEYDSSYNAQLSVPYYYVIIDGEYVKNKVLAFTQLLHLLYLLPTLKRYSRSQTWHCWQRQSSRNHVA